MSICKKHINFISLNVKAMVSVNKSRKIFTLLKAQNANMFLQETHCIQVKQQQFRSSWHGTSWYRLTDSPYSKGVRILFSSDCNVDVMSSFNTKHG